jgi:septum formation protein
MSKIAGKKLILASSSPRRQELIGTLGISFEIRVSDVNEDTESGMSPSEIVEHLSARKAGTVYEMYKAEQREDGIVIGSDTIVVLGEQVLGKPRDRQDAARMLNALQGNVHHVYSGIACMDLHTGRKLLAHRVTAVYMKALTSMQIQRYIDTDEPLDKAGSYAIQGIGATIIERIEGDYFNVVGLPMCLLSEMLGQLDVAVL